MTTNAGSGSFSCPLCEEATGVADSRPGPRGHTIRRRRVCRTCGHRFTTYEAMADEYANVFGLSNIEDLLGQIAAAVGVVNDKLRRVRQSAELFDEMKGKR